MDCEFVHAVANGQPMMPNFSDGARVQQLLDAVIQSAKIRLLGQNSDLAYLKNLEKILMNLRKLDHVSFLVRDVERSLL